VTALRIRSLEVDYRTHAGTVRAVRNVDLDVAHGERVGLVGESGSGKSTVVTATLGLLPSHAERRGVIEVVGTEIAPGDRRSWAAVRGSTIAAVPQGAMAGLHPAYRVDAQVAEVLVVHTDASKVAAMGAAHELLERVGLSGRAAHAFPHELSGGMRQRVALAAALACSPQLLIADEPTVGLDAVTAATFLRLLLDRQAEDGFGLLLVSHDLRTVQAACDRLAVAYAGRIVESGPTADVVHDAHHPYSIGLLAAAPSLDGGGWAAIPGRAPDPTVPIAGCAFAARCPHSDAHCTTEAPVLVELGSRSVACHLVGGSGHHAGHHAGHCGGDDGNGGPTTLDTVFPTVHRDRVETVGDVVVHAAQVTKTYRSRRWLTTTGTAALDAVDLVVRSGEIVGLVGPSGSGKSTLARCLFGLVRPESGRIDVAGNDLLGAKRRDLRRLRRRLALVHQDPYASLHPTMPIIDLVGEPLAIDRVPRGDRRGRVEQALALVGLDPSRELLSRRAGQLSGGQRQRVALARALVVDPLLVVLDEPMSMLDASVRAGIAQSLLDARDASGLAALVITHDLAEAAGTCDRLVVLDQGRVVEEGPTERVVADPQHPATEALLALATDPTATVEKGPVDAAASDPSDEEPVGV
jgi:peptide/nickel transport system ATP-binding protein